MSRRSFRIRRATRKDVPAVLRLIRALARYEKLSSQVKATAPQLRKTLFGRSPGAEVLLAERSGEVVGFALYFHNYSTFLARRGIYLEDLFVDRTARGLGIGKALFQAVGRTAVRRGCGRYEWSVLDWNQPAIDFYRRFGAVPMHDWSLFRLSGPALARMASASA